MCRIGIDIGSTYTKYCVLNGETSELFTERTPVRQKEYFETKLVELRQKYGDCRVVTCGYGRKNVAYSRTVTELTALAKGTAAVCPGADVVLDIGGQDTKLIRQENGQLRAFFTNDRCAAGCGLFLNNVLHLLNIDFDALNLTGCDVPELRLSSICAVFAQTEIVELIAAGTGDLEIINAVILQILTQARTLLGKIECRALILSGGLTKIPGIGPFAEKVLEKAVTIPEHGTYISAIGCALLAD